MIFAGVLVRMKVDAGRMETPVREGVLSACFAGDAVESSASATRCLGLFLVVGGCSGSSFCFCGKTVNRII